MIRIISCAVHVVVVRGLEYTTLKLSSTSLLTLLSWDIKEKENENEKDWILMMNQRKSSLPDHQDPGPPPPTRATPNPANRNDDAATRQTRSGSKGDK